ncbi:MAG: hypothetical protein H0T18_05065 [Chloroflexia bacterium]|nr:hypothetical protein [Chloroflexia bacterium]
MATTAIVSLGLAPAPPVLGQSASCAVPDAAVGDPSLDSDTAAGEEASPSPAVGAAIIQVEGEVQSRDATPGAALPAATPIVATPVSPPPDPIALLTRELTVVSESLAACLSAGDSEMVTELAGERYLGQLFGGSVPLPKEEYIAIADGLTPVPARIVAVADVVQTADDQATALVTQVVGNQLVRADWSFALVGRGERRAGESRWQVSGERQQPAPDQPDAAPVDVEIGDRSFTLDEPTVDGPDVILRGSNGSEEDHEMLVLRLAPGYTTADLLRATGPDLPREVTFIGAATVRAGDDGNLVLVNLEPGEYTIVCFFPDEQGTPHLAQGMEATFTVG